MSEIVPFIFAALGFAAGYFYGYGVAMRYCTKRLEELGDFSKKLREFQP